MGTRSRIGIQLKDNSVLSVYCHYDGYPEFNGRVLRDNYDTIEKVRNLIDGGDMSCTWTNAGWNNETLPESGPLHYTARGESLESNAPRYDESIFDFLDKKNNEEYAEHHKKEIEAGDHHDPSYLELFCDQNPSEPECLVYED